MNFKAFTAAALLAGAAAFAPTAAKALPNGLENKIDGDHYELLQSIEEAGARVIINDGECFNGNQKAGFYGFWAGYEQKFVVCTEASTRPGQMTHFSAEDLDTIRHEAIHMAQDLVGDKTMNGRLETISVINDGFYTWANETIPSHRMDVVNDYADAKRSAHLPLDSDKHIMNLEAEAEGHAATSSASEINDKVRYWAFGEESGTEVRQQAQTVNNNNGPSVGNVIGTALNIGGRLGLF